MGAGRHAQIAEQYLGRDRIARVPRSGIAGACGEIVPLDGSHVLLVADDLDERTSERVVAHLLAQHVLGPDAPRARIEAFAADIVCPR